MVHEKGKGRGFFLAKLLLEFFSFLRRTLHVSLILLLREKVKKQETRSQNLTGNVQDVW
jgi:hypothetical protein